MSLSDAVDRFEAVCFRLAANDAATRHMVPEIQALAALYSLDMPKDKTLESLLIEAARTERTQLVKTGVLSLDPIMQQQVKWEVAAASFRCGHLSRQVVARFLSFICSRRAV
jgi:hypothetical protein